MSSNRSILESFYGFERSNGSFSDIAPPGSILIHAFCRVKGYVTAGQSGFTVFTLPVSVVPTNAAVGLLVSVMQHERNELMM